MFDLNNDGNLDAFEQGLEYMFLDELTKDEYDDSDNDAFKTKTKVKKVL